MDDRLKESISALMDDEANELELQRVLAHAAKEELLDTWKNYHCVKSVLKHEHGDFIAIDISRSVAQAIEHEAPLTLNDDMSTTLKESSEQTNDLHSSSNYSELQSPLTGHAYGSGSNTNKTNAKLMTKISSGLAIAASIFIAFVFVLQNGVGGRQGLNDNLLASELSSKANVSVLQKVSTLSDPSKNLSSLKKQPKIMVEFTEEHARRFNEYLLRHAEHSVISSHSGMMPLARVASVNAVGI